MKFNVHSHFVEQVGCTENDEKRNWYVSITLHLFYSARWNFIYHSRRKLGWILYYPDYFKIIKEIFLDTCIYKDKLSSVINVCFFFLICCFQLLCWHLRGIPQCFLLRSSHPLRNQAILKSSMTTHASFVEFIALIWYMEYVF